MNDLISNFNQLNSEAKATFIQEVIVSSLLNVYTTPKKTQQQVVSEEKIKNEGKSTKNNHDSYTDDLKREVVELASNYNNNRKACREIKEKYASEGKFQNLSEKSVRDWRNDPNFNPKYDEDNGNKTRSQKRDIKGKYHDTEEDLIEEIKKKRNEGKPVSRMWIKSRAKDLVSNPNFQASDG